MAIKRKAGGRITGLSTDSKPPAAAVPSGSMFVETDTRKRYYNSGTDWILQDLPLFNQFKVLKVGTTTYIIDRFGKIQQSNSDTQVAIQAQINAMPSPPAVYEFLWDAGPFTLNSPIIFPSVTSGTVKRVNMKGSGYAGYRSATGGPTCLVASTSFPTGRYMFELNNAGASNPDGGMI